MKHRVIIGDKPTRLNIANLISKMRRMRDELAFMVLQIDDALLRIEIEKRESGEK
jgi:hypothetical protein